MCITLLSRSTESGPSDGTSNASTSWVIVLRVSENTTNPETFNGDPIASRKATTAEGTGSIMTARLGKASTRHEKRHISNGINSDCGHWIVVYRARNLHSARRKKQRKRVGSACQQSCATQLFFVTIFWVIITHHTEARVAWPLCTSATFGHIRRRWGIFSKHHPLVQTIRAGKPITSA